MRSRLAALVLEGEPVMLAFLIGTSILNVFLGYALAVYLMRASQTSDEQRRQANSLKSTGAPGGDHRERSELYPQSTVAATVEPTSDERAAGSAASQTAPSNPLSPNLAGGAAPATVETSERGPEEMDQQLLAGIADFRSQLAKLRSETGSEEPKRRPVARVKS